jgi:tetratricopeptide (TPR) repeat protein
LPLRKSIKKTATMGIFKATFTGTLEFGSVRTYETFMNILSPRIEVQYKNDIHIRPEIYFSEENQNIIVRKLIVNPCTDRSWKNTSALLELAGQYAVAGKIEAWYIDIEKDNRIKDYKLIEPCNDKKIVQDFKTGRKLARIPGREEEAITAYNNAINKFERHASAYEKRGFICYKLRRFDDAMTDFNKSISLYPSADAYFGRANVKLLKNDIQGALEDLESVFLSSVPLQTVYWQARRMKGECMHKLQQWEKAVFELKLVTNRVFSSTDPNYVYRKRSWLLYGECLVKLGNNSDAIRAFNSAKMIETPPGQEELVIPELTESAKPKAKPKKAGRMMSAA